MLIKFINNLLPIFISIVVFTTIVEAEEYSIEYKLASIEVGYKLPENHQFVKRLGYLLKSLSNKYPENKNQIGKMTTTYMDLLEKKGIDENMENIMEGLNTLEIPKSKDIAYEKCISSYVLLRNKGYSHKSSLKNIIPYLRQINSY